MKVQRVVYIEVSLVCLILDNALSRLQCQVVRLAWCPVGERVVAL